MAHPATSFLISQSLLRLSCVGLFPLVSYVSMQKDSGWLDSLAIIGFALIVTLALFIFLEGAFSTFIFVKRFLTNAPYQIAESSSLKWTSHLTFDPLLGWVNKADAFVPDAYGPGVFVQNNSQGFRKSRDVSKSVPKGKRRVFCVGDSFAFGEGVSNTDSWCDQLELKDTGLETVNLGMPGYGLDQAYLRYLETENSIEHDVVIVSLIRDDLPRMKSGRSFFGAPKPFLKQIEDKLQVVNLPLPKPYTELSWLDKRASTISSLRSVEVIKKLFGSEHEVELSPSEQSELAIEIFKDLLKRTSSKHRRLLVVAFPGLRDLLDSDSGQVVKELGQALAGQNIEFLDFYPILRELTINDVRHLYIEGNGHFSPAGNQMVAQKLLRSVQP